MRRYARYLGLALIVILGLAIAAGLVLVKTLEGDRLKDFIAGQVKLVIGRDLVIAGDLRSELSLSPLISAQQVSLANANWGTRPDLLRAKTVELEIALLPLLQRKVVINRLEFTEPELFLETDSGGRRNWEFDPGDSGSGQDPGPPVIREIAIKRGTLWHQEEKNPLVVHDLTIRPGDFSGEMAFELAGAARGHDVRLAGSLARSQANLLSLNLTRAQIAGTEFNGGGDFSLAGARPGLRANFAVSRLNLKEFMAEESSAAEVRPLSILETPLALDFLKTFDLELDLTCGQLEYEKLFLEKVSLTARLINGHLLVAPLTTELAGGAVNLELRLDLKERLPAASLEVNGERIDFSSLLRDFKLTERVAGGVLSLDLSLKGAGKTIAEMLAGLTGRVQASMAGARLDNSLLDYAGADLLTETAKGLKSLLQDQDGQKDQGGQTLIRCAALNYTITDGIACNPMGFGLETDRMLIVGGGTFDFKTRQLDLAARPKPRKGIGVSAGFLVDMLRLQGNFSKPRLVADKLGVAKRAASLGLALSTGGMSLLGQAVFDKLVSDPTPCETVLRGKQAGEGD